MKWKFENEFRSDHPETKGETDKEFDLDNYKDWLEQRFINKIDYINKLQDKIDEFRQKKQS